MHKCTRIVYSDASRTGFGGYEANTINGVSHGTWSEDETGKSSTWRELTAVHRVLKSLGHFLANQRVKWFTDNLAVSKIVDKGSMKYELQNIAVDIFATCLLYGVRIEI